MKTCRTSLLVLAVVATILSLAPSAISHCDTLAGPVVADARVALKNRDVTPVLKWLKPEYEMEIRAAFAKTLAVRVQSEEARELADSYFFEMLVRLHRQGEGAPYTGLKPAEAVAPIIVATDKALAAANADRLVAQVQEEIAAGLRERFARALAAKQHAAENVAAGREFVAAYVELTHFVESLHATAVRSHSEEAEAGHRH